MHFHTKSPVQADRHGQAARSQEPDDAKSRQQVSDAEARDQRADRDRDAERTERGERQAERVAD